MPKPLIFCLTPVKDESWILERFLQCASMWADHIIIADQGSTDRSREIARKFPKVTLIENTSKEYKEQERQKMLLAEARRIPGPKILFALDADEFLTANFLTSPEWKTILDAPPGTVITCQWPDVQANVSDLSYFYFPHMLPFGFVDDGSEHTGKVIHSWRVPVPPRSPVIVPTQIKVMHYCCLDWDRFFSRVRWYQCFEYLNLKKKPADLYRFYNLVSFVSPRMVQPVPKEWIQGYEDNGIDMSSVHQDGTYRWDREVLQFFETHGTRTFRRLAIWDADWNKLYVDHYPDSPHREFQDPRNAFEKLVHRWLRKTQPDFCLYASPGIWRRLFHKCVHRTLKILGW